MDSDALINLEAEQELLGSLMRHNGDIDTVADNVSPEDFSEPVLGRIFSALVEQYSKGNQATPITIKGYFETDPDLQRLGGLPFLARLTGNSTGLATLESAKVVSELAIRRKMRAGLQYAVVDCNDLTMTPAELVSRADEVLSLTKGDTIHQPTGAQCLEELFAGFGQNHLGVTCNQIPALDSLLGPMRPKQLIIGAGRPGMGKTAVALSYALGATAAGHGVLFVSLEMSSAELGARMAADLCFDGRDGVYFNLIRDGKLSPDHKRKLSEAHQRLKAMPLQVVDAGNLTVGKLNRLIRRHARRMEANGHKLELVVIDYLQLLSPDGKGRSNYEAVSEVSRALKAMAKDHGVAVFALAQLSREVEKRTDRRPQLSDLRDSGQIEQDADAVLFLLRHEYYLRQNEPEPGSSTRAEWELDMDEHAGKIDFILAKRRNGVIGNAQGQFLGAFQAVR